MEFKIYSKDGCPFCNKIEQVLSLSNLDHTVYKLDRDFTREDFYNKFGYGSTFPQVVMNDEQCLGGCTDTVKYLQENNIL